MSPFKEFMVHTQYYVFIHRPGPAWLKHKPIGEQALAGHFEYMGQLETSGILVAGGGFTDNTGAMGVLRATSLEEACAVAEADPAVRTGVVTTEVHPWFVTVGGHIQKSPRELPIESA